MVIFHSYVKLPEGIHALLMIFNDDDDGDDGDDGDNNDDDDDDDHHHDDDEDEEEEEAVEDDGNGHSEGSKTCRKLGETAGWEDDQKFDLKFPPTPGQDVKMNSWTTTSMVHNSATSFFKQCSGSVIHETILNLKFLQFQWLYSFKFSPLNSAQNTVGSTVPINGLRSGFTHINKQV